MKVSNAPNCGRQEQLLDFLYGELGEVEAKYFQKHLHECAACSEELAAFGGVRNSVISWRDQTLGAASSVPKVALLHDRRSALAALRAFFDFSPLWLKGAVAAAVILFFVLVGLSVRNVQGLNATIASNGPVVVPAGSDFNAAVERGVKEKLAQLNQPSPSDGTPSPTVPQRAVKNRNLRSTSNPLQLAQRPLSRSERAELAADLRLVSSHRENEADLLDDGN